MLPAAICKQPGAGHEGTHLSQSRRAAGGRMPKLSPALAAFVSGVHAAFAFAAMSWQLTHLRNERHPK